MIVSCNSVLDLGQVEVGVIDLISLLIFLIHSPYTTHFSIPFLTHTLLVRGNGHHNDSLLQPRCNYDHVQYLLLAIIEKQLLSFKRNVRL